MGHGKRGNQVKRLKLMMQIAHNDFPIPKLPPPPPAPQPGVNVEARVSPLPSSPLERTSSQEANKENAPTDQDATMQAADDGALPKQIVDMLADITNHLMTFASYPPHTIQRLAELVLSPRAHYRALASYLHAVDRVVQVTSGVDTYPLPPAISDMSSMNVNGEDAKDPAGSVAWSNPTTAALGTDEALGGALLTPIPWLTSRRSPEGSGDEAPGAQIHSESTETIDGPNGMGSIETVSVSVNGIPSTGHARGITQGELLRQEQRAGVVPVSQLSRAQEVANEEERPPPEQDEEDLQDEEDAGEEEEEIPHARGPDEIGVNDTGPQAATTSHVGEGGLEMRDIDVEAAVGRKQEDDDGHRPGQQQQQETDADDAKSPTSTEGGGSKREADQDLDGEPVEKKAKEDEDMASDTEDKPVESEEETQKQAKEEADDKMETDA